MIKELLACEVAERLNIREFTTLCTAVEYKCKAKKFGVLHVDRNGPRPVVDVIVRKNDIYSITIYVDRQRFKVEKISEAWAA